MSLNIFGTDIELQTEEVCFRGSKVTVSEITDEEYHQYVTLAMADKPHDDPEEIAVFNREATLRMLAVCLMPALKCPFDEIYEDLRTPGKYSRGAIQALIVGMNKANGVMGNSPTTASE